MLAVVFAAALATYAVTPARAQTALLPIKIAISGPENLGSYPVTLAKQLGFFKDAGLDPQTISFSGGTLSITAVLNGDVDLAFTIFDHVVHFTALKKPLKSIVLVGRLPGTVLVPSPKADIHTVADLTGQKVGVTSLGASSDFLVKYLVRQNGGDIARVPVIPIGDKASAVTLVERGDVAAAVLYEPGASEIEARYPQLRPLADTRTEEGTRRVFGGDYPGYALYSTPDWIEHHDALASKVGEVMLRTLRWIHSHSAEELLANMPEQYRQAPSPNFIKALNRTIGTYSATGEMDPQSAATVVKVLGLFLPEVAAANVDPAATYTNAYIQRALKNPGAASSQ